MRGPGEEIKVSTMSRPELPVLRLPAPAVLACVAAATGLAAWGGETAGFLRAAFAAGAAVSLPASGGAGPAILLTHLKNILALGALTALFTGTGLAVLGRLGFKSGSRWESAALGFGLGSGAWAYVFLVLGLCGALHRPALLCLLSLGALGAAAAMRRRGGSDLLGPRGGRERAFGSVYGVWDRLPWAMMGISVLAFVPAVLVPETYYDSLEYHLGLPNLYLAAHAIVPTPDNAFSGIPSVPAMLYGWALAADRWGVAAHALNYSFLLWTGAALVGLSRRLGCPPAGKWAALLLFFTPAAATIGLWTTVGLPWAFYQLLTFYLLVLAAESGPGTAERTRLLCLCGVFLGLAMSSKYLAWTAPLGVITFLLGLRFAERHRGFGWKDALVVCGVGGAVLLPWIIKSVAFYGNPIYPMFHERFAPGAEVMPAWRYVSQGGTDWGEMLSWRGPWLFLLSHWRMLGFEGKAGAMLGAAFFGLLPLAVLVRLPKGGRWAAYFLLGCWLPLGAAVQVPRYFTPCLALLALILALAVFRVREAWLRKALLGGTAAVLLINAFVFWRLAYPHSRWAVFAGRTTFGKYLSHANIDFYPAPLFPAAEFLDRNSPPDARILVFGDSRGMYLTRDHLLSTPFQRTVLERFANASESGGALKARLDAEGITHILVNHGEIVRQGLSLKFSKRGKRSLDEFWRRFTLKVFQAGPNERVLRDGRTTLDQWVVVYKVLSEEEAARTHPVDDLFEAYRVR